MGPRRTGDWGLWYQRAHPLGGTSPVRRWDRPASTLRPTPRPRGGYGRSYRWVHRLLLSDWLQLSSYLNQILREYFERYDEDNSGFIDSADELRSFCTNLVMKVPPSRTGPPPCGGGAASD